MHRTLLAAVATVLLLIPTPPASATESKVPPTPHATHGLIVIGHRGASGYRPEHTLESYRLAIRQGADFIEPDLVATKDGVLVARHENEISGTTDVARRPQFAHLKTTKVVDGRSVTGWFTEDFTLAELKTLRARERIPSIRPANTRFDGMYQIPTFAEVVRLAKAHSRGGRRIGVYPETKHPTYFAREGRRIDGTPIGVSLGAKLVETLVAEGFTDPRRVYIQSFEVENLLELQQRIMPAAGVRYPLVQLLDDLDAGVPYDFRWHVAHGSDLRAVYGGLLDRIDGGIGPATRYGALATAPALEWMKAHYASGLGPWKGNLLPREPLPAKVDANGDGVAELSTRNLGRVHPLLGHALRAGLVVHPYTLRAEEAFLSQTPTGVPQSAIAEAVQLYGMGVQGVFIDQPDQGVAARELFLLLSRTSD
jgi:glycerophosphoryl diester phosphodiesterase